jgi:hypothetical protein
MRPVSGRAQPEVTADRIALVVVGMHRSGTSALVRMLSLLGFDLPATLLPTRDDNPLGYWESQPVVVAQELFLRALGYAWDDVRALPPAALAGPAADELETRLVELLASEYGTSPHFVVKDPRICRLLPVWRRVLERSGAEPRCVLPLRDPLEIAASLQDRGGRMGQGRALLLWLRHVLEGERATRDLPRSIVTYDALLADWRAVAARIAHDLTLDWPRPLAAAGAEIDAFVDAQARNQRVDPGALDARADVADWVKRTYAILADGSRGKSVDTAALDEVHAELARAEIAFDAVLAEQEATLAAATARHTAATERQDARYEELRRVRDALERRLGEREQALDDLRRSEEALNWRLNGGDAAAPVPPPLVAPAPRPEVVPHSGMSAARLAPVAARWLRTRRGRGHLTTYLQLRRSGLFDPRYYEARYPDVPAAGADPLVHYVEHGAAEGRDPSPLFSTMGYRAAHPDLDETGTNPLLHLSRRERERTPPQPTPAPAAIVPSAPPRPTALAGSVALPFATPPRAFVRRRTSDDATEFPDPWQGPLASTDQSDVTLLVARQRSGTHVLKSVLSTHPALFCFGELFGLPSSQPAHDRPLRETNYFTFLRRYAKGDILRILPDRHEALFLDFLDYLRTVATKPQIVIDVKYNSTQFLAEPWAQELGVPFFFDLAQRHRLNVLNLTRTNYLRYWISNAKAARSGVFDRHTYGEVPPDSRLHLKPETLVEIFTRCRREDDLVAAQLKRIPHTLRADYTEVFPGGADLVDPELLARLAVWFGTSNDFVARTTYQKLSQLPLEETIANYDDVAAVLRGTEFEYCLEDEPSYRRQPGAVPATS